MLQDAAKFKTKPADKLSQPKNSSFMKPTASHLAKLPKAHGQKHSSYHCTRSNFHFSNLMIIDS